MSGKLYVIATPIGNLGDVSTRTVEAIQSCDFVLAEDTRVTIKLLSHFGIQKRLVSCHEYNESERVKMLGEANAQSQSVALISDAGTPLVSDPGYKIVQEAIALNMVVIPIPGPSAFLLALVGSGLPCDRFVFEGFLPDKAISQKKRLEELRDETRTLIFYVSPHKVLKTLALMHEVLGVRRACIAREITKFYEEFVRGTLVELKEEFSSRDILGEFVLVVEGANKDAGGNAISEELLQKEIREHLAAGLSVRDLSAAIAERYELKKSAIYKLAIEVSSQLGDGSQLGDTPV
jgi:16S rRNA (cytidine1402-2'-O)-methyltransferase